MATPSKELVLAGTLLRGPVCLGSLVSVAI